MLVTNGNISAAQLYLNGHHLIFCLHNIICLQSISALILVMTSASLQQSIRSSRQESRGWRDEINGNLIRFSNKICRCYKRAVVKVSESYNNPNKLYYCCMDSKHGCGCFKFWIPSPNISIEVLYLVA